MNITLKNLDFSERMSEETNCFCATVYVDGKKAFEVSNRGHGACNEYHVIDKDLYDRAEAFAKETQKEFDFEQLDMLIDDLLNAHLAVKEVKKLMKRKILFVNDKQQLMSMGVQPTEKNLKQFRDKWPQHILLNALPLDAAVQLYKKHG